MSLTFKLEVFEGPMDLLLSLIEKHKIDIYDIEISLLLDQYMDYIDKAQQYDIKLAADFLEMASRLMYIKSCSLLPKQEEEEAEEDPKALLEQMLIEYSKYKKTASDFQKRYIGDRIFFREWQPDNLPKPIKDYRYSVDDFMKAYNRLLEKIKKMQPIQVSSFSGIIGTKFVSVGGRIVHILRTLIKKGRTTLKELFRTSRERAEIVATFLALLELIRHGRIETEDPGNKGISEEIRITLNKNV